MAPDAHSPSEDIAGFASFVQKQEALNSLFDRHWFTKARGELKQDMRARIAFCQDVVGNLLTPKQTEALTDIKRVVSYCRRHFPKEFKAYKKKLDVNYLTQIQSLIFELLVLARLLRFADRGSLKITSSKYKQPEGEFQIASGNWVVEATLVGISAGHASSRRGAAPVNVQKYARRAIRRLQGVMKRGSRGRYALIVLGGRCFCHPAIPGVRTRLKTYLQQKSPQYVTAFVFGLSRWCPAGWVWFNPTASLSSQAKKRIRRVFQCAPTDAKPARQRRLPPNWRFGS